MPSPWASVAAFAGRAVYAANLGFGQFGIDCICRELRILAARRIAEPLYASLLME